MSTSDSPEDEPWLDPKLTNYEWPLGIFAGLWTFVGAYVAMGLVVLVPDGPKEGAPISDVVNEIGVVLYNAHNVVLNIKNVENVPLANPGVIGVDKLSGATAKPKLLYYAVPVVVLLLAGLLVARYTLDSDAGLDELVLPAAALSIGYTGTAAIGTFFVRDSLGEGAVLLVPDLEQTLVYGFIYSFVCALVASVAVGLYWKREAVRRRLRR